LKTGKIDNIDILRNSVLFKWLLGIYSAVRCGIGGCLKTSIMAVYAIRLAHKLYTSPVKAASIAIVCAIVSSAFFDSFLTHSAHKEIWLFGYIIKAMLLFTGLAGLFCHASLNDIISTSRFMKWIDHHSRFDLEEK
jgi:hypothetical protein